MGITGRPKSQNPKGTVASTRITAEEKRVLEKRFGSVGKGLRAALNDWLARTAVGTRTVPQAPRGPEVTAVIEDEVQLVPDATLAEVITVNERMMRALNEDQLEQLTGVSDEPVVKHFHKPQTKTGRVTYHGGIGYQDWLCDCGETITRKVGR